jgi:hypothetical protein
MFIFGQLSAVDLACHSWNLIDVTSRVLRSVGDGDVMS